MKLNIVICTGFTAAAAILFAPKSEACTNVLITPGASSDGSSLVSYAADSHSLFGELYFSPSSDWTVGSPLKIVDWDSNRPVGQITQVAHTYKTVGNMNEHQLIIGETTFGGRRELVDPDGGIDYGSLIYITLQRARNAREAITIMTDLVEEYGYCSAGESFSIADKEEVWLLEMVGKGSNKTEEGINANKGAVWVARRVPDGYICCHANQSRISTFPLNDPENCLFASDVISFARQMGYFDGKDEDFSFLAAYNPLDFSGMRACEARVWSAFNILGKGRFVWEDENGNTIEKEANDYLDYAMGYNKNNPLPLWIRPAEKVSVKNLADVMRDHFEGTPMDMTTDIGAGGNALPYRWRPMGFEWEGKEYVNERAIATQQTGFWFVGQARGDLPDVIGGIIWFATDDAATSYLTPIYTNTDEIPECFKVGNGDMLNYSPTASFWLNNRVSNACYKMYNQMAPFVRERIDNFENTQLESVRINDLKALELYEDAVSKIPAKTLKMGYDPSIETDFPEIRALLTKYSVETAQTQFEAWKELEVLLLVKFIDGNVKPQNEDGSFKHGEFSDAIPGKIEQPGYTDEWKKAVAAYHGETVFVPEEE